MTWVSEGIVFFLRPHQSLLKDDGVRAGVSWDSVLRIDGMVKLMLEQYRISYLPLESVSMQERVRAVEFVLVALRARGAGASRPAAAVADHPAGARSGDRGRRGHRAPLGARQHRIVAVRAGRQRRRRGVTATVSAAGARFCPPPG